MVLIFWPNFRLAVLIELVLIKKACIPKETRDSHCKYDQVILFTYFMPFGAKNGIKVGDMKVS